MKQLILTFFCIVINSLFAVGMSLKDSPPEDTLTCLPSCKQWIGGELYTVHSDSANYIKKMLNRAKKFYVMSVSPDTVEKDIRLYKVAKSIFALELEDKRTLVYDGTNREYVTDCNVADTVRHYFREILKNGKKKGYCLALNHRKNPVIIIYER